MDIISLIIGIILLFTFLGTSQTAKSLFSKKAPSSKCEEIVKYKL